MRKDLREIVEYNKQQKIRSDSFRTAVARHICWSLALAVLSFVSASDVQACSCRGDRTVLDQYQESSNVVRVKITSRTPMDPPFTPGAFPIPATADATVVRSFKGTLLANATIKLEAMGISSCGYYFGNGSVGREFLLFLPAKPNRDDQVWEVSTCTRASAVEDAAADLAFLNRLKAVAGKTRLSGKVEKIISDADPETPEKRVPLVDRLVMVTGNGKTYQLKTNTDGVYEIYGLAPGKYTISSVPMWGYTYTFRDLNLTVTIADKKHAELDLAYVIENSIRGRLVDTAGRPLENVCVKLMPVASTDPRYYNHSITTKVDGTFEFAFVPQGTYHIGVNDEENLTADAPFEVFYYPNVRKRDAAGEIQIGPGTVIDDLYMAAPSGQEIVTISGILKFSDGTPASYINTQRAAIQFEGEKFSEGARRLDSETNIDAGGRFTIRVFKGVKGLLFGETGSYLGKYENCPEFDKLYADGRNPSNDIKTAEIAITADRDMAGIELVLPFPACKMRRDDW